MTKILATVLLTFVLSSNVFAATVKSATNPLSGTYNYALTMSCAADSSNILPSGISQSYTTHQVGTYTFTPDTGSYNGSSGLQGVTGWLASTSIRALQLPNPNIQFTTNPDPTAAVSVNLSETPLQWGVMTSNATGSAIQNAYASTPILSNGPSKVYFVLTSFRFAVPANNNNINTGYAFYMAGPGATSWQRINLYHSGTATLRTPSFSFIQGSTPPPPPVSFYYDCLLSGNGTQ